ncbi:MAG: hypothetical protein LBD55_07165 [Treponema sp.]|nr:hypothetical protein [Treponema sp.]
MKRLLRFLFCYILALIPAVYGYAQRSQPIDQGNVITEIEISGLKRTKLPVAEKPLRKFLGREGDGLDVDMVYAAIKDTGILEPVSVEIQDRINRPPGKILKVEVREKWAIFPLPVVSVSSENMGFGGFFIDTNAFGLNDKFFLGGMTRVKDWAVKGWMAGGGYMHSPLREWFPGWAVAAFFSRDERHDTDQKNYDLRRFNLDSIRVSMGIAYPFTDLFRGTFGFSYHEMILRDYDSPLMSPESGARILSMGAEIGVRRTHWDGFLLSQESASLGYTFSAGIDSPSFHALSLAGAYEKSLIPGFRINLYTGMLYDPEVPVLFESSPSSAKVNILPASFSARHYAGASLGLEKYLFKLPLGTFSGHVSYQAVYARGSILGDTFDHGVFAALSFYLSQVAIPAFSVGAAYNAAAGYLQAAFSLGMSF